MKMSDWGPYVPSREEMDQEIQRFVEIYQGRACGESVKNRRENIRDNDYESIAEIYDYVINY